MSSDSIMRRHLSLIRPVGRLGALRPCGTFIALMAALRAAVRILPPPLVGLMSQIVMLQLPQSEDSPGNSFLYTVLVLPVMHSARLLPVLS